MPQPLSRVRSDAGFILAAVGTYPLRQRQELAVLAMECVATWSNVEIFLLNLYVHLAGGTRSDATAVFMSLESQSTKSAAINALVERKLDADQTKLFRALSLHIKTQSKERNKLAHWVWGYAELLPDALLLADPRVLTMMDVEGMQNVRQHIFVYRESDLTQLLHAMERTARFCFLFKWILEGRRENEGGRLYEQLCAEPEIRSILDRQARQAPSPEGK